MMSAKSLSLSSRGNISVRAVAIVKLMHISMKHFSAVVIIRVPVVDNALFIGIHFSLCVVLLQLPCF